VASLYLDHNVRRETANRLRAEGHDVLRTRELRAERANDDEQLLIAAERGRILLSHNRKGFELLHDAWQRWSAVWGVVAVPAGILVIPQPRARPRSRRGLCTRRRRVRCPLPTHCIPGRRRLAGHGAARSTLRGARTPCRFAQSR